MRLQDTRHHRHNVGVEPLSQFDINLAFGGKDPYKIYSQRPEWPPAGHLLLERVTGTHTVVVKFEDRTHRPMIYDGTWANTLEFIKLGIPQDRVEEIFTHLWNFGIAVVRQVHGQAIRKRPD